MRVVPTKAPLLQNAQDNQELSGQDCLDQLVEAQCLEQYVTHRKFLSRKEEGIWGSDRKRVRQYKHCAICQIRPE